MPSILLAFDRSNRSTDADGRLHVAKSHISKAQVSEYQGREIPGYESLGLTADRSYRLLRDPAELAKAAPTFARLPILSQHVPVSALAPRQDLQVGTIGSDVSFDGTYLNADLSIWDARAIAGIESRDQCELSCAYRYVPDMTPGTFNGATYDGRMTEIQGNHLALVEYGRAGSDVVVADGDPKRLSMKMTKLGAAVHSALATEYPTIAQDAAIKKQCAKLGSAASVQALIDRAKAIDPAADVAGLKLGLDAVGDEPDGDEPPKKVADDEDEDEKDKDKKAEDKEEDDKDDKDKPAMDAAAVARIAADATTAARAVWLADEQAREDVRPIVGAVQVGTAAMASYKLAFDSLGIDGAAFTDPASARAALAIAAKAAKQTPRVAQDSAGALTQFPGLARITQG